MTTHDIAGGGARIYDFALGVDVPHSMTLSDVDDADYTTLFRRSTWKSDSYLNVISQMSPRCISRVKYSVRLSRDRATLSKTSGATDRSSRVAFETASTMKSLPRCVNSARRLSFSQVHDLPIRVNRVNCPDANE